MSTGATPIDPDEWILRRIVINPGYYDPERAPPVEGGAFRPNPNDDDGLSRYLERELSALELVAAAGQPAVRYVVARLRAGDLYDLGLSLIPTRAPGDLPGHLIVPEINHSTYDDKAQRRRMRELCRALANLANQGIIFDPASPRR